MSSYTIDHNNHNILADDDSTKVIFSQPPLKAYGRAKNLRDLLIHCDPRQQQEQEPGTFPYGRIICRTCPHIDQSASIPSPGGQIKITGHFTCISDNVIYYFWSNCRIPCHIESVTKKRWLRGTRYAVKTESKTGSYIFCWLRGTQCLMNMQNGCQVLRGFRGSYAYVISLKMKYLVATFKERGIMLWLSRF